MSLIQPCVHVFANTPAWPTTQGYFLFKNMLHVGKISLHHIHFYSNRLILPRQSQRLVTLWKRRKCDHDLYIFLCIYSLTHQVPVSYAELILGLCPANERRRYKVTPSLIGWAQAYIQPLACILDPNFVSIISADIDALAYNSVMPLTGTVLPTTQTYFRPRFPGYQRFRINISWPNDVIQNGRQVLADPAIFERYWCI